MPLDEVIRFRVEAELKARFEKVAERLRRDPSDLARLVLEDFVKAQPDTLRDEPTAKPLPLAKPVSYAAKPTKAKKIAVDIVNKAARRIRDKSRSTQ